MDYFKFGEEDSRDYNIQVFNKGNTRQRILNSTKTNVTDRIIGRSGEVLFDQYYNPKTIPLYVGSTTQLDNITMSNIAAMLSNLGERKLILSYEDYKYHMATLNTAIVLDEYVQGGLWDMEFIAHSPFGLSVFTTSNIQDGVVYDSIYFYDSGIKYVEDMTPYTYPDIVSGQILQILS